MVKLVKICHFYLSKDFTVCSSFREINLKLKTYYGKKLTLKQILTKFKPKILINCLATHPYSKRKLLMIISSSLSSIINMIEFAKIK